MISLLGHLDRMEEDRMPKKIFTQQLKGTRRRGRPRKGWICSLRVCIHQPPHQGTILGDTRSETQWPLQHLKSDFCSAQTINVSAQTAVRDPCCLARQTPHLHKPHSLNTLQVSNLSALRLS
jgi:hypothetical protein